MYYERFIHDTPVDFATPREFLVACARCFDQLEADPLQEELVFCYKGIITRTQKPLARAFTKQKLALMLGVPVSRFDSYKKRIGADAAAWLEAVELVENIIYTQKFEHAAAGLLNSTILVRDLGLVDKIDTGPGVTVIISGADSEL